MQLFAVALAVALQAHEAPPPEPLLLTGAHVLSEDGSHWIEGSAVLVQDGRIQAVGRDAQLDLPKAVRRVAVDGLFLVPGLIDLHTHLLLHPYDETAWDDQVLREPLELRTLRGTVAARATLAAGFTTVRDLGTEGAAFADVALRDAIELGWIEGPRVLAATRAIVATGCYGPAGFDPRWDVPKGAEEADGEDGVRKAVRRQVAAGADWIKVYADYRRRPGEAATPTFSAEELRALVDEASSAGRRVAAHASTDEGVRRAVEAGVATIEHGTEASRATLELLRARGVALVPTLAASEAIARQQGWDGAAPEPERVARSRATFRLALEVGVTIGCGGDAGVFAHGDNARELELMVAYGMSPADALRSATRVAADILRRDDLGRIAPGCGADLVAFEADPMAGASALRHPRLVVKAGRVVGPAR
jgi:imidazolonepropionase-like amidohydrolase